MAIALVANACDSQSTADTVAPPTITASSTAESTVTSPRVSSPVWSRVLDDQEVFGGTGSQRMNSVTTGGPGLVAVGSDGSGHDLDAAVWTSTDAITWSRVPDDEVFGGTGSQRMNSVTTGGPGLVAVGSDGSGHDLDAAVWTSTDGIIWSRVPDDEVFGGTHAQRMDSVTTGGPGLVAVGFDVLGDDDFNGAVWTSIDGITWSRVPDDEVLGGTGRQRMNTVIAEGPGLVAVGFDESGGDEDAAIWTSIDGITWLRVPHDEDALGGTHGQRMNSVTIGGPGLVAVGSDGSSGDDHAAVWTSTDAIIWSRVPDNDELGRAGHYRDMLSVAATGPSLVAFGFEWSNGDFDGAVWTSADGISWFRAPDDNEVFGGTESQWVFDVALGGPGLVAVGFDRSGGDDDAAVWVAAVGG